MRDDLIEMLRAVNWEVTDDGDRMPDDPAHKCVFVDMRPDDFRALLREAAAAIEAAREDGWIACSDRLPGTSDHIEVWPNPDESTYNFYAHFNGGTNGVKAGNWYHNDRHGDNWIIHPTHWRPLSAPPAIDQARGKGVA